MYKKALLFLLALGYISAHGQSLKTYEGSFPEAFSFPGGNPANETVKYTYYVDEDSDERIFEGLFCLTSDKENKTVKGSFKKDKQDGEWIFTQDANSTIYGNKYRWQYDVKVNFNDGIMNGPLYYFSNSETHLKDGRFSTNKETWNFTINNGKIVGEFNGNIKESANNFQRTTTWKGFFDENGNPIDKWRKEYDNKTYIYIFTPGESTFEVKEIDERTGDIKREQRSMNEVPINIHFITNNLTIDKMFLRNTQGIPSHQEVDNRIYDEVTQLPTLQISLSDYISSHKQVRGSGRCIVRVTINKDGSAEDPVIVRGISRDLDLEVIRLIKEMASEYGTNLFSPGKIKGKTVNCHFTLNITL